MKEEIEQIVKLEQDIIASMLSDDCKIDYSIKVLSKAGIHSHLLDNNDYLLLYSLLRKFNGKIVLSKISIKFVVETYNMLMKSLIVLSNMGMTNLVPKIIEIIKNSDFSLNDIIVLLINNNSIKTIEILSKLGRDFKFNPKLSYNWINKKDLIKLVDICIALKIPFNVNFIDKTLKYLKEL